MATSCIGKTPEHYELAKKLTGEKDNENALRLYVELLPFVLDKWLAARSRQYSDTTIDGNFLEEFTDQLADTKEVQQYFKEYLKAYKQLDNVDFSLVQQIVSEKLTKPNNYQHLLKTFNITDHKLDGDNLYKDLKLQLIDQIFKGTLSKEMADKLGYTKNNEKITKNNILPANIVTSINTGKWTEETINEFTNLIKNNYGKSNSERRMGERREGSSRKSEIHEGASLVIGTKTRASKEERGNSQEQYEFDAKEGKEQERRLEAWAKAADLWLNDYKDSSGKKADTLEDLLNSQWHYLNIGSEAEVYVYDDTTVLKSINLSHTNDNPKKLLDRIALFNMLFPTTAMEVVGFGRDSLGHFRVIVTQPYVEGSELTEEDLKEFHKKYKLEQINGWFKTKYPGILITDLSPSNIIKDKNDKYHIIDADIIFDESAKSENPITSFIETTTTEGYALLNLNITDEDREAVARRQAEESRTAIEYNTEYANKTLEIQLDDVKFKMSVQDKRAALDIIADSFYNIINKVLQTTNERLIAEARERGVTVASLKVQYERQNREVFDSIEKENAFNKPNEKFIKELQSKVVPLTELDVIKVFGAKSIVDVIIKNLENNPKTQIISDNFDALLRQAASKINDTYGINILGNTELFDGDNEGEDNIDDQSNTDHNVDGSKEDFTHADDKTKASERRLTKELKLAYRQCFVTNERGQVVTNSYGLKVPVDHSAAHNKILHLLEGMIYVDDVIPMLEKSQEGWVKQFVIKLKKNPQLLNQLYNVCKLSAQDYRIVYYKDGKLVQKSLNKLAQEELVANETTSNITNGLIQTVKKLSIYTTDSKVNKEGIEAVQKMLQEKDDRGVITSGLILDVTKANSLEDVTDLDTKLRQIFKSLGITIPATYSFTESAALFNLENPKAGVLKILKDIYSLCNEVATKEVINTSDNYYKNLFKFIGKSDVGYVESSITENGKSYYTYSKTNYVDEVLLRVKQSVKGKKTADGRDYYKAWQEEHFGQSFFFKNPRTMQWYSDWMSKLFGEGSKYDKYRDLIARCSVLYTKSKEGTKTEFIKWSDVESMITNYTMYKEAAPYKLDKNEAAAWYRMPIASDSNASDYMQFVKYITDEGRTYDEILAEKFWNLCQQELARIAEVEDHLNQSIAGEDTSEAIKGYDAKHKDGVITDAGGLVFTLMPQLNYVKINIADHPIFNKIKPEYQDKFDGISFLDAIRALSSYRGLSATEDSVVSDTILEEDLKDFFTEVFMGTEANPGVAERDFNNEWAQVMPVIGQSEQEHYREYYYNYMYAWPQMVEMIATDTAFFGKRKVKEVSSAKEADFSHTRYIIENDQRKAIKHHYKIVSDDTLSVFQKRNKEYHAPTNKVAIKKPYFREVYIEDIMIKSEIMHNAIKIIKDNPNLSKPAKERLIEAYTKKVNVADGQSYRSLESYMEILDAKGQLTPEQRESFNRIIHQHTWDEGDLNIIALAIKPYFYATLPKSRSTKDVVGNKNIVMSPTQHKNSELPLTAALGAISASLSNSATLKALDTFMSKHNIDVVHFNSVVKVGETGTISIDQESTSVDEIVGKLEKDCGFDSFPEGDPEIVQEIPTESWGEQLSKPEHLLDARQLVGSQIRRAVLADLPETQEVPVLDENGNEVIIDGKVLTKKVPYTIDINGKTYTTKEFKEHYQDLITASLLEDFSSVDEIFKDPHKLEAFLQESIASSAKYDEDLLKMFTWDEENKSFKIPFWNRTVSNRVEEILLALIKNRIAKQKIAGGAAVQTAAVGLSKDLNVRYKKDSKLLDTYREWLEKNPEGNPDQYEKYIEGATLAYMEVYLPMWSKDMIEMLTDENGVLHYDRLPEELKYMVGYRIPTEDHYSCAPLYIKGFLPNLNASTIVVPADISTIAGSDYDIDVMYLMRPEFKFNKYDEEALERDYQNAKDRYDEKHADAATDKLIATIFGVDEATVTPKFMSYQRWRNRHIWDTDKKTGKRKYLLPKDKWTIEKIKYDTSKTPAENNRKARNNEFIDTIIGCFQSPHSRDKFTNVGNYDELKIASRICEILSNPNNTSSIETLRSKSLDELNDIVAELNKDKNIASPQVQTDLHQQNMAGNQLKGIFVAAKSLQEVLQHAPLKVIHKFTINGNKSNKDFTVGKLRANDNTLITKRFASYVAAAVDNGKDPLMNALRVNPDNANVVNYLTMLGYTPLEIGLFLNCASIEVNVDDETAKEIFKKYGNEYGYSALDEKMMALASANRNNTEDERVIAMALFAKRTFGTVQQQAQLLMTLAKGLRADSMNFKKSVPENLQIIFAIDNFREGNERINFETGEVEKTVFDYEKLPIRGAFIASRDWDDANEDNFNFEKAIKLSIEHSNLPYLEAFTQTLFTASTYWADPYTLYTKPGLLDIVKAISKRVGAETANKIVGDFIDAYQRMSVLNLPVFGAEGEMTLSQKREYLVKDFPKEFANFKRNLPAELKDNLFIDNIILVAPDAYDNNYHLEVKELGKSKDIRAKFKADCDRLAAYNPDMAMKLFMYTTFRNGFGYSQKGWAHLTSINFQENIPGYIETLQDMQNIDKTTMRNLFIQFLSNNYDKYSRLFESVPGTLEIPLGGSVLDIGEISMLQQGKNKYISFGGGYIRITPSLGAKNFYHEYFRPSDIQVSIFKDSDRTSLETDNDYVEPEYPETGDSQYNQQFDSSPEKNDEQDSRKTPPRIPPSEMKDQTDTPQC